MTLTREEAAAMLENSASVGHDLNPGHKGIEALLMGAEALREVEEYNQGFDWMNGMYNLMIESQQGYAKEDEKWHYLEGAMGALSWAWFLLTDGVVDAPLQLILRREILFRRFGRVS